MFLLLSLVSPFLYPHQCPMPLITPAAQNGIHSICMPQITMPHQPNISVLSTRRMPMPSLEWLLYRLCSIQSAGVPAPYELTISLSFDASWYNTAPLKKTCLIPYTCGLCGSPDSSLNLWCLRCTATHCLVTMPVVSHNQNLIKWLSMGWNINALCAWPLCKKSVTQMIVMCVAIRVYKIIEVYGY